MAQGYVKQCIFFTGLPGSCRFNEKCAFSHDLTVHVNSKYKYVAPSMSLKRTVAFPEEQKKKEEEKISEQHLEQTEIKEVAEKLNTYSKTSELQPTDRSAYMSKKFTLGNVPYSAPTSDLA